MKLGFVIYSNDAEVIWNVFRLANLALQEKDKVKIFLLAKGVEYEKISAEKFDLLKLAQEFIDQGGKILACGTCLKLRQKDGSQLCPISNLKELYQLVKESDRLLTF